jgi:hypothetical protein
MVRCSDSWRYPLFCCSPCSRCIRRPSQRTIHQRNAFSLMITIFDQREDPGVYAGRESRHSTPRSTLVHLTDLDAILALQHLSEPPAEASLAPEPVRLLVHHRTPVRLEYVAEVADGHHAPVKAVQVLSEVADKAVLEVVAAVSPPPVQAANPPARPLPVRQLGLQLGDLFCGFAEAVELRRERKKTRFDF